MANAQQVESFVAGLISRTSGLNLAGGKVYTYEAGTTTNKTTWTDAAKTTPATNPIILDSQGTATIYADGNYKFVVYTSDDVLVDTLDNVFYGLPSTSFGVVQAKSADYTVLDTDDIILVNATSGAITISLPTASTIEGKTFTIVKTDATTNAVVVDPNLAETINGSATYTLGSQYSLIQVISDGTNWYIGASSTGAQIIYGDYADRPTTPDADPSFYLATDAGNEGVSVYLNGAWHEMGIDVSTFIKGLLNDANAAAARTTLDVYSQAEVDAAVAAVTIDYLGRLRGLQIEDNGTGGFKVRLAQVEMGGTIYTASAEITKAVSGLNADDIYYIYVDPPDSGTTLAAADIEYDTGEPTYDYAKAGYYHQTNTDWRFIGVFFSDGSNNVVTFLQDHRHYKFTLPQQLESTGSPPTSPALLSANLPAMGVQMDIYIAGTINHTVVGTDLFARNGDDGTTTAAGTVGVSRIVVSGEFNHNEVWRETNTSGQFYRWCDLGTVTATTWDIWQFILPAGLGG